MFVIRSYLLGDRFYLDLYPYMLMGPTFVFFCTFKLGRQISSDTVGGTHILSPCRLSLAMNIHYLNLFDGWETLSSSLAPHRIGNI